MEKDSGHIPGFQDFERYLTGKMSFEEQHTFERQMLEDPALAEAFEGYQLLNPSPAKRTDLEAELQARLNERLSSPSRKLLPRWTYSAAAMLIIAAGLSWLFFTHNKKQDTALPQRAVVQQQPVIAPAEPQTLPAPDLAQSAKADEFAASPPLAPAQTTPKKLREHTLAEADVEPENEDRLVPAAPSASALGMLHDKKSDTLVLSKDLAHQSAAPGGMHIAARLQADSAHLPRPGIGWEAYRQYLENQTGKSNRDGQLTIQFTVNPDGSLTGFTSSANDSLSNRGIRLIQNGPAWKPARRQGNVPIAAPMQLRLQFRTGN